MTVALHDLADLDPEAFAWLGVALLKQEISPNVRQVARAGPDGGRDAVLVGPATTGRYEWQGHWVFQFKHYREAVERSRKKILRDLASGPQQVVAATGVSVDNYILLTSVPYSGSPRRGLFDRAEISLREAEKASGLRCDLWDGLEIVSLLNRHWRIAERFFPRLRPQPSESRGGHVLAAGYRGLRGDTLLGAPDDVFFYALESLLGRSLWVLAPGSESVLWQLYLGGEYVEAYDRVEKLVERIVTDVDACNASPEWARAAGWLLAFAAVALARIGKPAMSVRLTRIALGRLRHHDPELLAWSWNVLSLAYGKLEQERKYMAATRNAERCAEACGAQWLANTVRLRALHKASWARGEQRLGPDRSLGDALLATASDKRDRLSHDEVAHLHAQEEAYLALEYTWHEDSWDLAERAIRNASSQFIELGDESELARLTIEAGRLQLYRASDHHRAVQLLREGLKNRVAHGELPRARYDLLWLGEALQLVGFDAGAEACMWSSLAIHAELYGGKRVDSGVVKGAQRGLSGGARELTRRARGGRLDSEELLETLVAATGLAPTQVASLVDVRRVKHMIASGA